MESKTKEIWGFTSSVWSPSKSTKSTFRLFWHYFPSNQTDHSFMTSSASKLWIKRKTQNKKSKRNKIGWPDSKSIRWETLSQNHQKPLKLCNNLGSINQWDKENEDSLYWYGWKSKGERAERLGKRFNKLEESGWECSMIYSERPWLVKAIVAPKFFCVK